MPRTARAADLALSLPDSSAPLRHRIADALVAAIESRLLRPGDHLPSTRTLAASLRVSRAPVVAAYDELVAAGFVVTRQGSGAVVADEADRAARAGATTYVPPCDDEQPAAGRPPAPPARWDLRPGRPDTTLIDEAAWRRAWRAAGSRLPDTEACFAPSHEELRTALAHHLRRSRGVAVDADDIVIAPGVASALHALPAAFGLSGRRVAVEDPGYVEVHTALERSGARPVPVSVDDDGLDPSLIPPRTSAVYVTPSHQYPLGARLPVGRRAALLHWAERTDGIIFEDDYDGEFRYDVSPLPALRSLPGAADRVVYIGTASKLLAPSLRVAWLIPPRRYRDALRAELVARELSVNEPTGLALAEFISSGALVQHQSRASRTYAARRARLVAALATRLPHLTVSGVDAGLHVVLLLPDGSPDHRIVDRLAEAGLAASPLSAYAFADDRTGLVLCYAGLPETAADAAVRVIAEALEEFGTT